jgi:regulation of enolase protein 1 (concanavalin A-like superfamily)
MASYEAIEPEEEAKGTRIWTAIVRQSEEYDGDPTLYVLTKEEFHYFRFKDEEDQVEAAYAVAHCGDAENVTADREILIPLDSIVRVERLPGEEWLYIQSDRNEKKRWDCIHCPDGLGRVLFRSLRTRLSSSLRLKEEPQSVFGALVLPLSTLIVIWFVVLLTWMGAKSAQEHKQDTGNTPAYRDKGSRAVAGAKWMGSLLGESTTLVIGGVASLGILGWGAFAIAQRPMKKVLVPRRKGERIEKEERDDADEEEATETPTMRPRSGKSTPEKRGKKTRRNRGKKARVLGIVALVLGVPALALGWLSSIQLILLLIVLIGLGVGIAGVLSARAEYGEGQAAPIAGTAVNVLALAVIVVAMVVSSRKSTNERDSDSTDSATAGAGEKAGENKQGSNPSAEKAGENKQGSNSSTTPDRNTTGGNPAGWGEPLDPDGDCKIAVQGNSVVIDVPATVHGLTDGVGKANAPRVLQEIEGDFSIQVKVCGTLHPLPRSIAAGTGIPFQAGGLLLWDDADHFVRFVRSGQDQKGTFRSVVAFTQREPGKMAGGNQTPISEQDVFLKMERHGNDVFGYYSLDGKQWTQLQTLHGVFPLRVKVGVMALNNVQQPMSVRFEGLRIGR